MSSNRNNDDDELEPGHSYDYAKQDAQVSEPVKPRPGLDALNALFAKGFTVPEHLRMNSVYGKFVSDSPRMAHRSEWTLALAYFMAKKARTVLRVV